MARLKASAIAYSDFLEEVRNKHVRSVVIQESGSGI